MATGKPDSWSSAEQTADAFTSCGSLCLTPSRWRTSTITNGRPRRAVPWRCGDGHLRARSEAPTGAVVAGREVRRESQPVLCGLRLHRATGIRGVLAGRGRAARATNSARQILNNNKFVGHNGGRLLR